MQLDRARVTRIIRAALAEDIGRGDVTTSALIGRSINAGGVIVAKEGCVVCALPIAGWTLAQVDPTVSFKPSCKDGESVSPGRELAFVEGCAAGILRAERTMLNFISFLSGIATTTKQFVDKAKPYGVKVMDTRKTMPLLRYLEKYAVSVGGGFNHRMGLFDQVLIKDNHIGIRRLAAPREKDAGGIRELVRCARKKVTRGTVVEVEVGSIEEFNAAIAAAPDIIMLDNMRVADVRACVEIRRFSRHQPLLEVSGGIRLENIEEYAKCRVDMISIGSLTSSLRSIDMSLEIV